MSRGTLVGLLWPEAAEATARNRLNTCVHRVRKALGRDVLRSLGDELRLDRAFLTCDVWRFEDSLSEGDPAEAVDVYKGPFLDGFRLRRSPAFEKWVDRERSRLQERYHFALETLAEEAAASGDHVRALHCWRKRAAGERYDARVTLRLMQALADTGRVGEALRVAGEHAQLLRDELDAEPDPGVRELAVRLRNGAANHSATAHASAETWRSANGGISAVSGRGSGPAAGPPQFRRAADRMASLDPHRIGVLPFQSLDDGEEAERFAAGLHSDLLTRLARVRSLEVISRTSVLGYRTDPPPIPEIARALQVGTIVEGEVQVLGRRLRVNIQLIDARSDIQRWAEAYDREFTAENMFDIQSDIVDSLVAVLHTRLGMLEAAPGRDDAPTEDLEAYRLVVMGFAKLDQRTEAGMSEAAEHFHRAVALDPSYALAWAGRAQALTLLCQYGYLAVEPWLSEAEMAANRSISLDPGLAAGHASLMLLHDTRCDGPAAVQALVRAVELQPSYAEAHNWLSWEYALLGRPREALRCARRSVRLNPLAPEAVSNLALGHLINGNLEAAVREARRVRELAPDFTIGPFYEALALYELGRFDHVIQVVEGLHETWAGHGAEATLALAHAACGQDNRAREWRARFEHLGDSFASGMVWAAQGEVDRAFDAFERADVQAYWPILSVHHLYRGVWAPLCDAPRFTTLLGRVRRAWGLEADGSFPAER